MMCLSWMIVDGWFSNDWEHEWSPMNDLHGWFAWKIYLDYPMWMIYDSKWCLHKACGWCVLFGFRSKDCLPVQVPRHVAHQAKRTGNVLSGATLCWDFTLKSCPRADLTNLTTQLPPEDLMGKEGPWFGRRSTSMQLTLLLRQVQCAGWECRSSLWIWRFHGWKSY